MIDNEAKLLEVDKLLNNKIIEKKRMILLPRRFGKTTLLARRAAQAAINGSKVLVYAASKEHLLYVFEMIKERLPYSAVTRDVSAPYMELALIQGGRIRGFYARGRGVQPVGQQADVIMVDNFDRIDAVWLHAHAYSLFHDTPAPWVEFYGTSKEVVVDSDEHLFDSKMRWPRSLFHQGNVELTRDILKDNDWLKIIVPKDEEEDPGALGACKKHSCRGYRQLVNLSYCRECLLKIDSYYAQKCKEEDNG